MNLWLKSFRFFSVGLIVSLMAVTPLGCSDNASSSQNPSAKNSTKKVDAGKEAKDKTPKKKKKKKAPESGFAIDKLPPETPVIVIGGKNITKKQYADWLEFKCRIILEQRGKKYDKQEYERTKKGIRSRIPTELIRLELMRQYAATNGIVPSAERLKAAEDKLLGLFGKKLKTIDQVAAKLGGESAKMLPQLVYLDAIDAICIERNATNDLFNVTDAELDAQMARIKKWNETADEKTKESIEKGIKAKKEILAGAFFENVAKKYAEVSPEDGHEWETVELGEFQADEPLAQWLMTAKVGDISDPIEYDDVIAIFGLRAMYDDEASEGSAPVKQYDLVRCSFHAYEKIEEPADRDELKAGILEERRAVVFRELGTRLLENARIELPQGEAIFNEIRRKPPKPPARKKPAKKRKATQALAAPSSGEKAKSVGKEPFETAKPVEKQSVESTKEVKNEKK